MHDPTHDPIRDLRRYAADLAAEVSPADARRAANRALAARPAGPRRAVVAVVTTVLFGISNVALAATADPAVPGDALYGIDRAYERVSGLVGIGGIHAAERLAEADTLLQRGDLGAALELVTEVLTAALESGDPAAAIAELEAAVGGPSVDVMELVALARSIGSDPSLGGQDVADVAKRLVERIEAGPPADSPGATAPGQTGDTPSATAPGGPPEDPAEQGQGQRGGGQP